MTARLLAGTRAAPPPLSLREHLGVHGTLPPLSQAQVLRLAEDGGVRGRGGGGFPLARKLHAAAGSASIGRRPLLVANGSEGEPASRKDRTLLTRNPHLVLDGVQLAARAIGAREAVVCVHAGQARSRLLAALSERGDDVPTRVEEVPDRYIAGEAGALASRLGGGRGLPTTRTAPLAERGPHGRPTLVQNVETLASLAVLARLGADRFRAVGTPDEPGTLLLTVRGDVARSVVLELPVGTPVRAALDQAGVPTEPLQAVLVGGYYGSWLPTPAALDVPLSHAGMRAAGGSLGAGLVVALPASMCGLAATAQVADYLAGQSARQCGPCTNGLPAIAGALQELVAGVPDRYDQLRRWCGLVTGRGACSHPDGVAQLVSSALRCFAVDVAQHLAGGCGRPAGDLLGVP